MEASTGSRKGRRTSTASTCLEVEIFTTEVQEGGSGGACRTCTEQLHRQMRPVKLYDVLDVEWESFTVAGPEMYLAKFAT